ncbi:MAG: LysR family transcriptional regulator [Oscillospiraceae bacterium]|nr:LysR family transcriptional regulator [Oscillospiraceae bacterium]
MEFQQIRYFLEICKYRSFVRAAENCFISPQGISMSMQRLESELQYTLFIRRGKELRLTEHAKFLLPIAEQIIYNIDACERYFHIGKHLNQRVPFVLSSGAFEEFAETPIRTFEAKYPHIYLDLRNESDLGAEIAVKSKVVELALCPAPIDSELFDAVNVCSSNFAIYVQKKHPLAKLPSVRVKDLIGSPLTIMHGYTKSYSSLLSEAENAGVELWVENRADSMRVLFELADHEAQVGIATMALQPMAAAFSKRNLVAIPFQEESLQWRLHLIKRKGEQLSPDAELLYDVLISHLEKQENN